MNLKYLPNSALARMLALINTAIDRIARLEAKDIEAGANTPVAQSALQPFKDGLIAFASKIIREQEKRLGLAR